MTKGWNFNQGKRGFTIVELLIVVVAIAILAAITIVSYTGITQRAKTTRSISTAGPSSYKGCCMELAFK